jgi:hypothetical protein
LAKEKQLIPQTAVAVVMRKMKFQENPNTTTGRTFSSNFTTPTVSFEALQSRTRETIYVMRKYRASTSTRGRKRNNSTKQISQSGLQL